MKNSFARLLLALALVAGATLPSSLQGPLFAQGVALELPVKQFFTNNGVPLAGGKLFSYDAGTLVAHATFADSLLATPNANPTILDANGRGVFYLAAVNYKFILQDSLGNVVWTQDNVPALAPYNFVNAATLALVNAAAPATTTTVLVGSQLALPLAGGTGPQFIRCNNSSTLTIRGIVAGLPGQHLTLFTSGTGRVDLSPSDPAATIGNQLALVASAPAMTALAPFSAPATASAELVYDGVLLVWRLINHEQGAAITVPFNAANFAGVGNTWTVASTTTMTYYLRGRQLTVTYQITGSTIVGAAGTALNIAQAAYGGYTWSKTTSVPIAVADNGTAAVFGFANLTAAGSNISNTKPAVAAFAASAANASVFGVVIGEVQ